jgi:hypothetical protein
MTGNVVGEPIEDFVDLQIRTRQSTQFSGYNTLRTDDQLKYLTNRNAWVKLASSVNILADITLTPPSNTILNSTPTGITSLTLAPLSQFQTQEGRTIPLGTSKLEKIGIKDTSNYLGTKLAEKAVLFNTISQYTPGGILNNNRAGITNVKSLWNDDFIYGIGGTEFGIQPPPGIIGVTIDSLNRGSIRKANITLKAHNKFQFDIIELLYLRLGFTMMLEWGWDKYLDSKGVLQQTGNTIIEEEWFKTTGTTQLQMLNTIQKKRRNYQGNYDGFFGKVSNFTWNFNPDGSYDISIDLITLGDVIESLKVNTSVKEKFYPDGNIFEDIKFKNNVNLENTNIAKAATLNTLGYFLYKKIKEISDNKNKNTINYITLKPKDETTYQSPQYYIRLSELLTQLENLIVPKIQNNNSDKFSQISFEKNACFISYFPNQIPLDPRVCIFKTSLNSYGDLKGADTPSYLNNPNMVPYILDKEGSKVGLLTSLYINFEFISGLLIANGNSNQELSLFKFLQDLCNGINDALGGVNKLEPVIKEDYKITLIDQTLSSFNTKDTVSLEVYGYNPDKQTSNFVKDIKFVSKITPQLASMISIGATAAGSSTSEIDGTAFSKWSEGLLDRFSETISEPNGLNIEDDQSDIKQEKYRVLFDGFEEAEVTDPIAIPSYEEFYDLTRNTPDNANKRTFLEEKRFDIIPRIVNSPFYGDLKNEIMNFPTFVKRASEIDKAKKLSKVFNINEISELTSVNYGLYLIRAFGGTSDLFKEEFENFANTPGFVNQGGFSVGTTRTSLNTTTIKDFKVEFDKSRYQEFDEVFISQGKSAYKTYINILNNNRYKTNNIPSSEIGFIPLSFELVLDGISGIKIYNKLKINNEFLPSNYPESLSFIITKVNHNISNNSWDTSLSTISIPRTEPYKYIPLPTPENAENTNSTGNTSNTITGILTPQPGQSGKFEPLKSIAAKYESGGKGYGASNTGTNQGCQFSNVTDVENMEFRELRRRMQLPSSPCDRNRVFAAGKYQITPLTLFGGGNLTGGLWKQLGLKDTDKYTPDIQEKMFTRMLLNRTSLGNYLTAKNEGTLPQLSAAIQDLSQLFASMPTIKRTDGNIVGNVELGTGNTGYYLDSVNSKPKAISVRQIAKIIVQTRINYSNDVPQEYPSYYTSPV